MICICPLCWTNGEREICFIHLVSYDNINWQRQRNCFIISDTASLMTLSVLVTESTNLIGKNHSDLVK